MEISRGKHTTEGPAKSCKTTWDVLYERSIYNAADVILTCCVLHSEFVPILRLCRLTLMLFCRLLCVFNILYGTQFVS